MLAEQSPYQRLAPVLAGTPLAGMGAASLDRSVALRVQATAVRQGRAAEPPLAAGLVPAAQGNQGREWAFVSDSLGRWVLPDWLGYVVVQAPLRIG
jgi:hypothetical protein